MFLKKKKHVFIFLKTYCHCESRETICKKSSSDDILLENFSVSNSIILVEDQIRWKRGFEIFLIDHYAGDIGNKNIVSKY